MKKLMLPLFLGLIFSSYSVYAENTDNTTIPLSNDINVTAPTQQGSWSFGATGGLMQPMNNANISNAHVNNNTLAGGDVTYAFPNSSNDASLSYERGF
ncbi:MAG: hypothetical protein K2Q33_02340 [Gammaproteobacteria bacterium]|nr:hypothetical protein [Gammaproteobacteria bacterium]